MRDDSGTRRRLAALLLVGTLAFPQAARAQGIFGTVQLQYQDVSEDVVRVSGDGTRFAERTRRESWLRTIDVHKQDLLRPNLLLESNLRFSGTNQLGTGSGVSTPEGGFRLMHPYLQLSATHAPTSTRTSVAARTGVAADSAGTRSVVAKNAETSFNGHIAMPRLPQLDLSWTRNRRGAVGAAQGEAIVTRNARMTFDRDRYSAYGGWGDSRQKSDVPTNNSATQLLLSGGGSLRMIATKDGSLSAQYDFNSSRARAGSRLLSSTRTHSAGLAGDWRTKPWVTNTMSWQWRRTDVNNPAVGPQDDQEGAVLTRLQAGRVASLTAGGGIRTVRVLQRNDLQKYVTAMASAEGQVRPAWTVTSNASHTTTWDPERGAYGSEMIGAATRAGFGRSGQWDASWQLAASGDSASVQSRYNNSWASRVQATPLRNLTLALSLRSLRVGPGLLRPTNQSTGAGLDLQWRPMPTVEFVGTYGTNATGTRRDQRSTTHSLTGKVEPSQRFQLYGSFTRSDQTATVVANARRLRNETVSGRIQWQPSRRIAASSTVTINQPGRAEEARQYDFAFTWSFGR